MIIRSQKIMGAILSLMIIAMFYSCANDKRIEISSPDGSITLELGDHDGMIMYSVYKNNILIMEPSALGMKTDQFDFVDNIKILSKNSKKHKKNGLRFGESKKKY